MGFSGGELEENENIKLSKRLEFNLKNNKNKQLSFLPSIVSSLIDLKINNCFYPHSV